MTGPFLIRKNAILISVLICAAVICYANSFAVPFLWDDEVLILRNQYIRDLKHLGDIFTTSHFRGGGEGGNFYRPLQIVSYSFDYSLWRFNPFGFHLTNLVLHILVAVAVFFLIATISGGVLAGFLSALFFAVHPVHTEAVTYIAGRADLQVAVFLLAALFCFIHIPQKACARRYLLWFLAAFAYICALLSKESALVFLFLALLYGLCFSGKKQFKAGLPIYLSFFLLSCGYVFLRTAFLAFPKAHTLSLIAQAPVTLRLLTIPKIWLTYLGLLIFPVYLHMERHFLVINAAEPYLCLGLGLLVMTAYFLRLSYRRWRRGFFYVGWFVITLTPVLNIVPLNATMAEHWLYLPAVGFWALAAEAGLKFYRGASPRLKKVFLLLGCLLFGFYCARTIMRNFQWRDPLKLYAHDLRYSTHSFLLHNNLGVELFRRQDIKRAGEEFQAAVKICPRYATSRNNLAVVRENQGKIEEAIAEYQAAVELNSYILAFGNLGRLYLKLHQADKAQEVLEKGYRLYPQDVEIIYHLGLAYLLRGELSHAREKFTKISQLAPHYKDTDIYLERLMAR